MAERLGNLDEFIDSIIDLRNSTSIEKSLLVAISGIDGAGKGFITSKTATELESLGIRNANINIDGWLNLPEKRFSVINPAYHYYMHAIRFEEMFSKLIFPLQKNKKTDVEMDYATETATRFRNHNYIFKNVEVILLEGIYLLKNSFKNYYDLSCWIECSFETALQRAIQRSQEGLSKEETINAYNSIYFPAQRIHFTLDDPKNSADLIVINEN